MRIFLVQGGTDLEGNSGYSLGLLKGEQRFLLCSFVDFMKAKKPLILPEKPSNRRRLRDRKDK